jgi:hypothetical protein
VEQACEGLAVQEIPRPREVEEAESSSGRYEQFQQELNAIHLTPVNFGMKLDTRVGPKPHLRSIGSLSTTASPGTSSHQFGSRKVVKVRSMLAMPQH